MTTVCIVVRKYKIIVPHISSHRLSGSYPHLGLVHIMDLGRRRKCGRNIPLDEWHPWGSSSFYYTEALVYWRGCAATSDGLCILLLSPSCLRSVHVWVNGKKCPTLYYIYKLIMESLREHQGVIYLNRHQCSPNTFRYSEEVYTAWEKFLL